MPYTRNFGYHSKAKGPHVLSPTAARPTLQDMADIPAPAGITRNFGVNSLRRSYSSFLINELADSPEERSKIAYAMGHSTSTHLRYACQGPEAFPYEPTPP